MSSTARNHFCACGNVAVTNSNAGRVCQRCRDIEHRLNATHHERRRKYSASDYAPLAVGFEAGALSRSNYSDVKVGYENFCKRRGCTIETEFNNYQGKVL